MSYIHNKQSKDTKLCQALRRAINLDRKRNGFSWDDIANELGISGATLDSKLKPAKIDNDLTLSEADHFIDISGDVAELEYRANKHGYTLIKKNNDVSSILDISNLADKACFENNDVFKAIKISAADGAIDKEEIELILKEIEEAESANAILRARITAMVDNG